MHGTHPLPCVVCQWVLPASAPTTTPTAQQKNLPLELNTYPPQAIALSPLRPLHPASLHLAPCAQPPLTCHLPEHPLSSLARAEQLVHLGGAEGRRVHGQGRCKRIRVYDTAGVGGGGANKGVRCPNEGAENGSALRSKPIKHTERGPATAQGISLELGNDRSGE